MSTDPSAGPDRNGPNRNVEQSASMKSADSNGGYKSKRNCNRKKKKVQKWAPLDLNAIELASEADDELDEEKSQDLASNHIGLDRDQRDSNQKKGEDSSEAPVKGEQLTRDDSGTLNDTDPKPAQRSSAASALLSDGGSAAIDSGIETLHLSDISLADTLETKTKFAAVMAHLQKSLSPTQTGSGGDVFDSLDWDPDLPSVSPPDKSPEPVSAEVKPISYTTVGSVVNPNVVPQFTAPNRIQRVGAARRPLMGMTNRQYDHLLQSRAPQNSFNAQNSVQYTQQFLQSSPTLERDPPNPSRSMYDAARKLGSLTELEKQVLSSSDHRTPPKPRPISSDNDMSGHFGDLQDGNRHKLSGSLSFSQGMEKMQTLQRLARFENPMQEHAINRLSEFSVANSNMQTVGHKVSKQGSNLKTRYDEHLVAQHSGLYDAYNNSRGEINHGHQFPHSAYGSSSIAQANPLFGAYGASTLNASHSYRLPQGYPRPLTAGPPGQRLPTDYSKPTAGIEVFNYSTPNKGFLQNRFAAGATSNADSDFDPESFLPSFLSSSYMNKMDAGAFTSDFRQSYQGSEVAGHSMHLSGPVQTVWDPTMQQRAKATDRILIGQAYSPLELGPQTDIRDTLSPNSMSKYYPYGRPFHVGNYRPLSATEESTTKTLLGEIPAKRDREAQEIASDDIFYHGQRIYHMTAEQHIEELEKRQPEYGANPFGPICPPPKNYPPVIKETISSVQMESMTVAEATAPILDAAFSTLLAYSETSKYSRTRLSRWVQSPDRYIDDTVEGAKSLFEETSGGVTKSKKPSTTQFKAFSGDR